MNVLLLTSHSIAEHDDLQMFTRMGVDTFSIGAYTDPAHPSDDKRPPLPDAPHHAELADLCQAQREWHAGDPTTEVIDWAKGDLAQGIIDWADTIIVHHFPEAWIGGNWPRIRDKRVIWRTCGQSNPWLEQAMSRYRAEGLQIVRYSPKERPAFEGWGAFAGEDAMIQFGKDPDEWSGWTGDGGYVANVTQRMRERGDACGLSFWLAATDGLPARPAGEQSEQLPGGVGALSYDAMRAYLRSARGYLYTGTQPASYTLGLIEALMTGVPTVSIGPDAFGIPELFEGHELATSWGDETGARQYLNFLLKRDDDWVGMLSAATRKRAIETFGLERVMDEWAAFLGVRVAVAA